MAQTKSASPNNVRAGETDIGVAAILPKFDSNTHVFSIDVEEWFQVGAYEQALDRRLWSTLESRVDYQLNLLLDLLASCNTRATLFWLGSVAEAHPRLVRRARAAGHEIACHGWAHHRLTELSPHACLQDIKRAKHMLEDIAGVSVIGYRAPSFSLTKERFKVYEYLSDLGFCYSSSIYPLQTDHYGMPDAPRKPYWAGAEHRILECPMTTWRAFGRLWPVSGGGYYRLLPQFMGGHLFKRGARQLGVPGNFYMHPWEVDPDQPKVPEAPFKSRFRHRVNQSHMLSKINGLLGSAHFTTLWDGLAKPLFSVAGRL